jgi:hypothetical protein
VPVASVLAFVSVAAVVELVVTTVRESVVVVGMQRADEW